MREPFAKARRRSSLPFSSAPPLVEHMIADARTNKFKIILISACMVAHV